MQVKLNTLPATLAEFQALPRSTPEEVCAGFLCALNLYTKIPNLSGTLFLLIYSGFQPFPICFTYSLTLLSPLFPGVPAPYVVIYVVKNASRPVSGEDSPVPDGKRFAFQIVCIVTLSRVLCKWFLHERQLSNCGAIDKE